MRIGTFLIFITAIIPFGQLGADDLPTEAIVNRMIEQVKKNMESDDHLGSYQKVVIKKFKNKTVNSEEARVYRTIWIDDHPYSELVQVNDSDLTSMHKAEEFKRKGEFTKAVHHPSKPKGIQEELKSVRWWELSTKYEFEVLTPTDGAKYVLAFQPKDGKLKETNRVERILNHIKGTIWLDPECNVIKAQTSLVKPVTFAWGIAKLDEMYVEFLQQEYGGISVPSELHITFKAHAGIFRSEYQDITATWYDIYRKPAMGARISTRTEVK